MSEMSVASINERAAEEYFKRGLEAEKEGNHERAIEFYERALNENPDHETACFNLAVMYDRRADDAKAIELYERVCTSPPVHLKALMAQKGLRLGQAADGEKPTFTRATPVSVENVSPELLTKSVADLELSVRSRKALQRLNINSLGELASRTEAELLGCKNFGQTSLNEIKQQLSSFGMSLRKLED